MFAKPPPSAPAIPRHVAIIMDGNGRWARRRGLPRSAGHRAGVEAVRRTVKAARALGIEYLTVFAFSSENWRRPADEVGELLRLFRHYLRAEVAELHAENVRLRFIGQRDRLPADIREMAEQAEALTAENTGNTFIVALSYGGRAEIANAARALAEKAVAGEMDPAAITEEALAGALYTADIPDPDLLIRTSGERRISNFLLWQLAYAEMVFIDKFWPDFQAEDLSEAIAHFGQRERRFGGIFRSGGR